MTNSPDLKKRKVKKQLILSAANVNNSNYVWRDPKDTGREFAHSLEPWIEFAKLAEEAKFHNVFFVDQLSWFDVYGGDFKASAKHGVHAARIDPAAVATAIASHTENVGIVITFSTISEHPYHFARRLASLDLLTNGRVGWNIVSSYLKSMGPNLLNGEPFPEHDERYVKTREFVDVVYKLLLSSWREDAIVYDKEKGIFADPRAIREINHEGKYYNVKGPSITEPTPQGFPLIVQAGTSEKGIDFAAENAELIFVPIHSSKSTTEKIAKIRRLASQKYGRDPHSVKFIAPLIPFLGKTHEEAEQKLEHSLKYEDPYDSLISLGGMIGIDLSGFAFDEPIQFEGEGTGITSITKNVFLKPEGTPRTPREIATFWRSTTRAVGTGEEVAQYIQKLVEETDIDGINFVFPQFPDGFRDVVDILVPELQRLGLAQKEYPVPGGTFRENFWGQKGQVFLDESHPAFEQKWEKGLTKEQFEKRLNEHLKVVNEHRA